MATSAGCLKVQMQESSGERGGYLHGRGALDSDDILYLKEQKEAEDDAERLLRRTEKRAYAAFKKAVAEASPASSVPLPLRVEPKPKSGIRQQDLLKRVVEVKPKRQKAAGSSAAEQSQASRKNESMIDNSEKENERLSISESSGIATEKHESENDNGKQKTEIKLDNPVKSLLAAYESSDEDD